jgi:hypothetical protein
MSLRIIELDPADTFHSARDRLLQNGRERTVLVLPERSSPLSGIDLVLLRRLADRERLDIGLVTGDKRLSRQARAIGLPAFSNLTLAEHYRPGWWRAGRRSERVGFGPGDDRHPSLSAPITADEARDTLHKRRLARLAAVLAVVLILSLTAIAAVYALPRATVTLRPASLPAQVILDLSAGSASAGSSAEVVTARPVQYTLEWQATGTATGNAAADEQRVRAQALQGLGAVAPDYLNPRLDAGELLIPSSVHVEILEETVDRQETELKATYRATISGSAVAAADVNRLAYKALLAALPPSYSPDAATLRVNVEPANGAPAGRFQITAQATGRPALDVDTVAEALRGQRASAAGQYLNATLPLAEPPMLNVWPSWWWSWFGRLPLRAEQIEVEIRP